MLDRYRFLLGCCLGLMAGCAQMPEEMALDSKVSSAQNAGLVVGALVNQLGVERQSFLIDVHPSPQSQYYAVASARVDAPGVPYLSDGTTWLDIEISLQLSSTTLSRRWQTPSIS